ncbi:MAG: hypothetical protein K6G20_03615, partial [Ruminococcus sp.]|nr:hypothetical protein [Ruminococcus sp.]
FVNRGMLVELVPETLVIGDWKGTAYIAIDLKSGSASYMISGGTAGGSSETYDDLFSPKKLEEVTPKIREMLPSVDFEDLFVLNNTLFVVNYELGVLSMSKGYCDLVKAEMGFDAKGVLTSSMGMIGSAFSIGAALSMRYNNYNFIFKYAEKGEECMDEYLFFTMRCIMDTIVNVMTFIGSLCGDAGSVEAAIASSKYYAMWLEYDIEKNVEEDKNPVNPENIYSGMAILWNLLGAAFTLA